MRRGSFQKLVVSALAVLVAPLVALAGGPLYLDPATGQPLRYGPGPVSVYTDLGPLGILSNEDADAKVAFSWQQWTDVATSSFEAHVAGDFAAAGLPDITAANAGEVIGAYNGGGIHVIYDTDGTVLSDFFGVSPFVLGIATPEYGIEGTAEITESWVILNGNAIDPADTDGAAFAGVMTHEFGHSINLAHSQTNGAIIFFGDEPGPRGCGTLPYDGAPGLDDMETMYPFIGAYVGGTGVAQSTVDHPDDMTSISNVYPAPGWPQSAGTISGTITLSDGATQVTGVNVVARNVADPWGDAVSALSGDYTQGQAGADGRYTLNGLTPGGQYVVYVDSILFGGFSTPPPLFFPGAEEFYNAGESGDGLGDATCDATPIAAGAGATATADISFNTTPGSPGLNVIGVNVSPFEMTADGETIVGYDASSPEFSTFRWTERGGLENIGGIGLPAAISRDGSTIASSVLQDGFQTAAIWQGGTSWEALPTLPGYIDGFPHPIRSSAFGVSNGGATVVGLGMLGENVNARAFRWDAATNGTTALDVPADTWDSRANGISADGSVIYGWKSSPQFGGVWEGTVWIDGTLHELSSPDFFVGEAHDASDDGSFVVGTAAGSSAEAWRWTPKGGLETIGGLPGFFFYSSAFAVSDDGRVITGQSASGFDAAGFVWTRGLGVMRIEEFLASQGTFIDSSTLLYAPNSMSASGRRIAGAGLISGVPVGWYFDVPKVKVCHAPPGNAANAHTIEVPFPEGLDAHLAHGDYLGDCSCESGQ